MAVASSSSHRAGQRASWQQRCGARAQKITGAALLLATCAHGYIQLIHKLILTRYAFNTQKTYHAKIVWRTREKLISTPLETEVPYGIELLKACFSAHAGGNKVHPLLAIGG